MSRQPTWDTACRLQAEMFREAAAIGGLDVQLVYFRGLNECRASRWVSDGAGLGDLMGRIDCVGGHTQIRKVLSHARAEHARGKVAALVYVGDAMEEAIDDLAAGAGELGLLGVPAFVFQEGHDPVAEHAFREIARLTRGAYCRFDLSAAHELAELLRAAAVYAAGGVKALADLSAQAQRGRAEAARADEIAMTLLFGLAALAVLLWMAQKYLQADPRKLAAMLKLSGGIALLGFAALLAVRGQYRASRCRLRPSGSACSAGCRSARPGFGARTQKSTGQVSRVRSAFLEMELDHDTGAMRGVILAGPREGTRLEALDVDTLVGLLGEIDEESRALLAAYLDRRDAGWREHAQADAAAGRGSPPRGPMTHQEAYQILGLEPGASTEDIVGAHRTLMKRLHPDLGGTQLPCGSRQRSQGHASPATSLRYSRTQHLQLSGSRLTPSVPLSGPVSWPCAWPFCARTKASGNRLPLC